MKKRIYIAALAVLLLTLIAALAGCGYVEEQEKVETNNVVWLTEDTALSFDDFVIVRAGKSNAVIQGATIILRNQINKLSGVNLTSVTDTKTSADKEILVGVTNRLSCEDELLLGRFKIVREGNTIAIFGGSDQAVLDGVNYIVEHCISEKGFLCGDGFVYFGGVEYGVSSIKVNGSILKHFKIKNELESAEYAERIAELVEGNVGIPAEIIEDGEADFIITEDLGLFGLKDGQWAVAVKGDNIYLVADNEYTQKAAYEYFVTLLAETEGALKFQKGIYKQDKIETKEEYYEREQLVIYDELPAEIRRSYEYKVSVTQGNNTYTIPVYDHTMEYDPINCGIGGDNHRRFSQFAFSGKQVRVDIKVGFDFGTYTVFPSAKQFESSFDANTGTISVYLDEPDYFGVRLDNNDNTIISVFADYPEFPLEVPSKDDDRVIYIDGWYEPEYGLMDVELPYTTLYIAPGAVLNARVKVFGSATGAKILGRGVILDPFEDIYNYDIRSGGTEGSGRCLCSISGKDSIFDGPVLMDARCFNLAVSATGVTVRNYKALSSMMTTDGITANSGDTSYEHCWLYCGDNALVISWSGNQVYRDITIGTTCSAIFPQGSTNNVELDGIYVFRANGGILNNWYNGQSQNAVTASVTIKNLDCIDANTFTRFFGGRNMGTLEKTYNFINVNLPSITGEENLHKNNGMSYRNRLIHMQNPMNMFTENYTLNFTNLYINGNAIKDSSRVYIENSWENEFNFSNDGTYKPVERHQERVRYKEPLKVYVGALQVMFEHDILLDGGQLYVPADAIVRATRANDGAKTVDLDGISYIKAGDLKLLDTVESIEEKDGILRIVLKNPQGNILLPDEGEISQIAESTCYTVDLVVENVDGETVYTCYAHNDANIGGMSYIITEEIKLYGAGKYTIAFKAKASNKGEIRYGFATDDAFGYTTEYVKATLDTEWQEVSYTTHVTEKMHSETVLYTIRIEGVHARQLEYFSFKDLVLIKQ